MTSLNENKFLIKMMGTDPTKKEDMQPKEVLSYSIAGLGQNIICQLVTTFFMLYMTDVAGVSALWLAWMFLGARLFDAFNDPIMGSIVEMTRTKAGKMRPYLKYSPIPIAILTVLLFVSVPGWSDTGKFAYSTIIYLLWGIAYTSVDVPYWGLASSMTSDTEKRNTLLTIARLFCTIGSGAVSVFIPVIIGNNGTDYQYVAYPIIAVVSILIAIPTFWIGYKGTKERFYDAETDGKFTLIKNLKLLGKNKPALIIILIGVLGSLRTIYMTTAVYYAKYNLRDFSLAGVIFLLVVPGGLAATLLTPVLSNKFGKKAVFFWSHIIGGVLLVALYLIGLDSDGRSVGAQVAFYIIIILAGVPSGFSNIMTYSMIADSIDYLEDKTGERAEAFCFSLQTFISKIGMAMTAFVTLVVLGEYGYDASYAQEGGISDEVWNSADFQHVLEGNWMATTLLCGLSMFACAIPLLFYTFNEKKQNEAVARVLARKIVKGDPNPTVHHEFVNAVALIDPVKRESVLIQIAEIFGLHTVDELMLEVDRIKHEADIAIQATEEVLVEETDDGETVEEVVETVTEISADEPAADGEEKPEDNGTSEDSPGDDK
ncbi:MAG TPA: MFS transporter [Candidatus Ornithoclostridium excrementipullorum]|nr:MFS transporter [Candidatus Ornithoclostridium excrementipullorum]